VNQSFISGLNSAGGLAVDGTYIYWTNGNAIGRANLDGTGVNESFITGASAPGNIAVSLVPEPATGLLVMGGVLALAVARRRVLTA